MEKWYCVTLYRSGNRYVKHKHFRAKYPAKKLKNEWEQKYDRNYYVVLEVVHV